MICGSSNCVCVCFCMRGSRGFRQELVFLTGVLPRAAMAGICGVKGAVGAWVLPSTSGTASRGVS